MDLLTTEEAAKHLNVNVRNVQNYIKGGKLRAQRFGRDYMISREDLEAFDMPSRGRKRTLSFEEAQGKRKRNKKTAAT